MSERQLSLFNTAKEATIDERFRRFHAEHPEVYDLFKLFSEELLKAGCKRYSSDAILHRIRWHYAVSQSPGDFKINNSFTSRYARKLMGEDRRFEGFFELRKLQRE